MTDSIKNLASSVDWSKLLSRSDAKGALVGSALGGLLLGGASLDQDRDPEESKLEPIGDALTGALLGGVAGYGIPKGLSLFRDSGTLAPDDDQLHGGYRDAIRRGAKAGAVVGAGTALPSIGRGAWKSLLERSNPANRLSRLGFWRDIMHNVENEAPVADLPSGSKWTARIKNFLSKQTNGSQFRAREIPIPLRKLPILRLGPKSQIALKGGKYAVGGAALAALSHALFGNSSRNNFKN